MILKLNGLPVIFKEADTKTINQLFKFLIWLVENDFVVIDA